MAPQLIFYLGFGPWTFLNEHHGPLIRADPLSDEVDRYIRH